MITKKIPYLSSLKTKKLLPTCRVLSLFVTALLSVPFAWAQTVTSSPYSKYGIGELNKGTFAQGLALGSAGRAFNSPNYINLLNPASYSSFELTVFEAGAFSNTTKLTKGSSSQYNQNASLAYVAFGIPVTKNWGASFGILPFSNTGYVIKNEETPNVETGKVNYTYQGSGGINKVYVGNGFSIKDSAGNKILSAGFNASYLFGSLNRDLAISYSNSAIPFNTSILNTITVSDFIFDLGIHYKQKLNDNWRLKTGVTYSPAFNLNAKRNYVALTYLTSGSAQAIKDTAIIKTDEKGSITLPSGAGIGIALEKNEKLLLTLDYSFKNWSGYRSFGARDSLKNSSQISAGIQYTPEYNAINRFLRIIQYRIGVRYSDSYLNVNNTPIKEYGISFGVGLPVRKSRSIVNLSIEAGQRGSTANNLIKEQFLNANVGITINDKWFIKRKYD